MTVATGRYRTVVQFQTVSTAVDSLGQPSSVTTNDIRTGARVTVVPVGETTRDGLGYPAGSLLVDVRYSPAYDNITTQSEMVIRGVAYEIVSIDNMSFENRRLRFTGVPKR